MRKIYASYINSVSSFVPIFISQHISPFNWLCKSPIVLGHFAESHIKVSFVCCPPLFLAQVLFMRLNSFCSATSSAMLKKRTGIYIFAFFLCSCCLQSISQTKRDLLSMYSFHQIYFCKAYRKFSYLIHKGLLWRNRLPNLLQPID